MTKDRFFKISKAALLISALVVSAVSRASPEVDIKFANVPAKAQRIGLKIAQSDLEQELKEAGADFSYRITFGRLPEAHFYALKGYFRKNESLNFDSDLEYELIDFLPAKMQALLHRRFEVKIREVPDLVGNPAFSKNTSSDGKAFVYSQVNCWATVWELTRDPSANSPLHTFMASRRYAQKVFESPEFSTGVKATEAQFGDSLLWYANPEDEFQIQHAALYIGHGYYFEKTNAGSEMFYRIVHLDEMKAALDRVYVDHVGRDGRKKAVKVKFQLRRFDTNGNAKLPSPISIFSAANTTDELEEYLAMIPESIDRTTITLFADNRADGGDDVFVEDMASFKVRLNKDSGRGEIDPASLGAERFRKAD